jgi:CRISPR system Cascade subunit CasA
MNLITSPWIPVRRQDGARSLIAPWQITDTHKKNPIVAIDATRAPWNAALTEFLISLLQTALFPVDAAEWRTHGQHVPDGSDLKGALLPFAPFFDLEGDRPFMQDGTLKLDKRDDDYRKPIQKFLVDGVSEQQEKNNSDLFEKSGAISCLCAPCTASALWDMQAHAPQGSAGYYTSLRGGGPSSTIVLGETLWETVHANLLEQACFDMKGRPDPKTFLPWMKPANRKVKASEECPLHVYWGMPRRVLLEKSEPQTCDTCGSEEGIYRSFLSYRGGFHYSESDWRHPLSPYIRSKDEAWLVRATESDIAGYRHYMGILVDTPQGDGIPSLVVRRAIERGLNLRVWGYGYQCDQAAVVSWCEGVMPVETGSGNKDSAGLARTLVAMCQRGVERLSDAFHGVWDVSEAGGSEKAKALAPQLWMQTAPAFREQLRKAANGASHDEILDGWVTYIQRSSLSLYRKALPRTRVDAMWAARYEHKLAGQLSSRNPMTLKTRKFGDWKIEESVSVKA